MHQSSLLIGTTSESTLVRCYAPQTVLTIISTRCRASPQQNWTQLENSVYITLSRIGFGLALAFILSMAILGKARIAKNVLSLPVFTPLSTLTFGAYLVHCIIIENGVCAYVVVIVGVSLNPHLSTDSVPSNAD